MNRFQWIKKIATPPPPPPAFALQYMYSGQESYPGGNANNLLDTATFASVPLGANDATRELFVVMAARRNTGTGNIFSSVTVAGSNCTMLNSFQDVILGFNCCLQVARVTNPGSMTSGNIVVNLSSKIAYAVFIAVYRATNRVFYNSNATDFRTYSSNAAASHTLSGIVQPADGFTFVASINNTDFTAPIAVTPAGWTKDAQVAASNQGNCTSVFASNKGGGLTSVTHTFSSGTRHQKTAAWSFYG